MKSKYVRIICTFLLILLLNLIGFAQGEDVKTHYIGSKPLVIHSLPNDGYYDSADVFVDMSNRITIFYSYEHKKKSFMSVFDGEKWNGSFAASPCSKGMVNNGTFQVYGYGPSGVMRIYSLSSDMKLSSLPTNTIKDNSRKAIRCLLPFTGDTDKLFAVGNYTESRLTPSNLIPFIRSGGHGASAERLFGAIVEKDKITGYYDIPGPVEENEHVSGVKSVAGSNAINTVWVKHIRYSFNPEIIKYSSFDLSNKCWSKPEELFRGDKDPYKINLYLSPLSLACRKENVYCAWSLMPENSDLNKKTIGSKMESGVYLCSKTNGYWDKPVKLIDSGSQPQVIIDNDGTVYVFWIEENGLFYKCKTGDNWSSRYVAVEDKKINREARDFPPFESSPISISVDRDNNLHIVYTHRNFLASENPEHKLKPEEIIYVKLTCQK